MEDIFLYFRNNVQIYPYKLQVLSSANKTLDSSSLADGVSNIVIVFFH